MKNTTLILLFLSMISLSYSQDEGHKSFKVSSFNISLGTSRALLSSSISDYNNLKGMVEDPEIFIDPNDFSENYFNQNLSNAFSTKIQIGITPYSQKKGVLNKNREIRIGIGMNSGTRRSFSFIETETIVIDTFYSVNGNPNIYKESYSSTDYTYSEKYTELNFNIAYLFKTDVEKRAYFYAGLGAEYGITLQSYISLNHVKTTATIYNPTETYPYGNDSFSGSIYLDGRSNQTNLISPTHFIRAHFPIGINFRISNNNAFFKHLNIYSEISPGIEYQMASNNFSYINPYLGVAICGLSYKF